MTYSSFVLAIEYADELLCLLAYEALLSPEHRCHAAGPRLHEKERAQTAGNKRFTSAVTMAMDHPDLLRPASAGQLFRVGLQLEHLQCIYWLLKSKCGVSTDQHTRLLNGLEMVVLDGTIQRRMDNADVGPDVTALFTKTACDF